MNDYNNGDRISFKQLYNLYYDSRFLASTLDQVLTPNRIKYETLSSNFSGYTKKGIDVSQYFTYEDYKDAMKES